jgi:hypothetical protein
MFSWHVNDKRDDANVDDDGKASDAAAGAMVLSAARQLVVGRGWVRAGAVISYA